MKTDLSQEVKVIVLNEKSAVSGSGTIETPVIDLRNCDDIAIFAQSNLSAGRIDFKIEEASDKGFTLNKKEITEEVLKTIVKGYELIRENKKQAAALYFTSSSDKKLDTYFGIKRDAPSQRYLKITFNCDGSAAATNGLTAIAVLKNSFTPAL